MSCRLTGFALCLGGALWAGGVQAQSASWLLNPVTNDFNTGANWSTGTVPLGTAIFGASNTTSVSIAGDASLGALRFNAGTQYSLGIANSAKLSLDGAGIQAAPLTVALTNNGVMAFGNSSTAGNAAIANNGGTTLFLNGSTAGNATVANNNNGFTKLLDTSTAGNAIITNKLGGALLLFNSSTAGNATITNDSTSTVFSNASTAGNATITNNASGAAIFLNAGTAGNATITTNAGGSTQFWDTSTAGRAAIANNAGGQLLFVFSSTAGNATIANNGGNVIFLQSGRAGSAAITNNAGGTTQFGDTGTAGNAAITNNAGGQTFFANSSTAGNATITNNGGNTYFWNASTAANATITINAGGSTHFRDTSTAGNAAITTNTGGAFVMSGLTSTGMTAGSIAGGGTYDLGDRSLTVGSNNLSTEVSGVVSGLGGSLVKLGSGTLTLLGANTYSGGTTVNAGILQGNATSLQGTIVNNASVVFDQAIVGTYAGNMSGTGGLTKDGIGTLTLAGDNSYSGGTTVNAGTLRLGSATALPTTGPLTVNGGTLDFNGNNVTVGSLSGLGGTLSLGSGTLSVAEAGSTTFAGTITGTGGLAMQGPGMLSLTGANTYTGPTTISGGRLAINGSITSDVMVGPGGNLGGTGIINGSVTVGGTASPGNSIGTLSVVGAYTQAAGSSYQVETNSAGQADRINVTGAPGTATIAGGTVTLTAASGVYAPSTTYTILNATGGVTGTYAGANSLFPFLQPSLSYDANNVYLTLRPGGFAAGAATSNQSAVGRVLDQSVAGSSGDFATVIGTLATYTQAQGQAAMAAISGQNYSGFGTANLGGGLMFMNMLGQQMSLARGGFGSGDRMAVAQACDVACDGEAPSPWSLWGSALGGTGSVAGNANAGTLTYNAGGFATGADYRFDQHFLAGFGVGYASGNQWLSGFSGQGTTNSYQASLYASFTRAAFYLDGLAGYGYNDNQMTRQIVLPNLAARIAQGRAGANQLLGQAEAGYKVGIYQPAAASITPFARFQATTNSQTGFSESGAGALNLNVAPQTTSSARSVLGAELAGAFGADGREKLAMQLRLGWAHDYADTARPVTASFAGAPGANFTVFGAAPQRDAATVSVAANTPIAPGVSLYARYDGDMGAGTSTHALNGGLRVTW